MEEDKTNETFSFAEVDLNKESQNRETYNKQTYNRESLNDEKFNEEKFEKHHLDQVQSQSQKDVFFIWMIIMFISVLAAHFVLNFTGSSPTGFVTASQSTTGNATYLLGAMLVVFIAIMITGIIYVGVTKKDY